MVRDADVIVVGSGGFGAATAYFLMRRGGRRVVLLDRHELASQTSPRAAGNAAVLRSTDLMSRLAGRAVEWLLRFTADTGEPLEIVRSARTTTPSAGCRRSSGPGRTSCTRRASGTSRRFERSSPRSRARSTSWRAASIRRSASPSWRKPASSGSAWAARCRGWPSRRFSKGAREMKERGGFTWLRRTIPGEALRMLFAVPRG